MSRHVDPAELMSISDVADAFGVGPSAVSNWTNRGLGFPEPVARIGRRRAPLFLRPDVMAWGAARADVVAERADRQIARAELARRRAERAKDIARGYAQNAATHTTTEQEG